MTKRFITLALLLTFCNATFASHIKGSVKSEKENLSGVIVTDGFNFTQTDEKGNFELETDPQAEFVYLVTPKGYVAPYTSGTPIFYLPLSENQKKYHFELIPTGNKDNTELIAMADVQTRTEEQVKRFQEQSMPDLKATIQAASANTEVIGISLGDIVWDHFEHFPIYKQKMAELNIPVYPVIGNHDHDEKCMSDIDADSVYKFHFGPNYYAFQVYGAYVIVLDNILYKGERKYDEALTQGQIEWVKGLTQYIPKGSRIIVASHSPFRIRNKGKIPGTDSLLVALQNYRVDLISGHTHLNSNDEIAPGVIEHNLGAICGTWWTADENRDGAPNGYQVYQISDNSFKWYYKSTGHEPEWQFKIYPEGTDEKNPDCIIAKVWNWDKNWTVKWYEDGIERGEMKQFTGFDPDYLEYVSKLQTEKYTQPVATDFYFWAIPSPQAKKIEVEVTDRFGRTYPRQSITR